MTPLISLEGLQHEKISLFIWMASMDNHELLCQQEHHCSAWAEPIEPKQLREKFAGLEGEMIKIGANQGGRASYFIFV